MSDTEVAPHDAGPVVTQEVAATCLGVKVPQSSFLTETRIDRINAARYEGQEIAGALHVIREDDRVLEVGAGLGVVGAVIATNAKPEKVLSFEANPELVPVIRALHQMNDLGDQVELRNQVLFAGTDRPDSMEFHLRNSFL
ncbi:MAG: FkbM family methyltransferase, partial [Tritonibacter mobilis]|nr:FkbM family methyltransferase [Tritonibacter mobilis]